MSTITTHLKRFVAALLADNRPDPYDADKLKRASNTIRNETHLSKNESIVLVGDYLGMTDGQIGDYIGRSDSHVMRNRQKAEQKGLDIDIEEFERMVEDAEPLIEKGRGVD